MSDEGCILSIDVKNIQDACHDWMGVKLTGEQIFRLLDSDLHLKGSIQQYGFDTTNREEFGDLLCHYLLGPARNFPRYRDGKNVSDQFWKDFRAAATEKGIELVEGHHD